MPDHDDRIRIIGDHDEKTVAQLERCVGAEEDARGVLCADGHLGYSQPIGGVVAYREHVSPAGAGYDIGCIAAGTPVTSEDGWHAPVEAARASDPLTCWDGAGLRAIDPCLGAVGRGRQPVVRVRIAGGREVVATSDHELRTKLGWRRADELPPGEPLACSPFIGLAYEPAPGAPSPALLRVAAYVAGDGHLHTSGKVVSIYTSVPEDAVAMRDDVLKLGFDATIDIRERGGNVKTQYVVRASSVRLHRLLRELGIPMGRKALAWRARALTWLLELPAWMRAHFLSSFASAEATTPSLVHGRIPNVAIKQAGAEPHAIEMVARLAQSLGFRTGTSLSGPAYGGVRTWLLQILGGEAEQLRFMREVGFCRAIEKRRAAAAVLSVAAQRAEIVRRRAEAVAAGRELVAAGGTTVREAIDAASARYGVSRALVQHGLYGRGAPRPPKGFRAEADSSNEIAWLPVLAVEPAGEAEVFDVATRDGAQSFLANGVVVHNCGNKAVRTPLRADDLRPDLPRVMDEVVGRISFGVGRSAGVRADHPILDEIRATDFRPQRELYDVAADQLGTVGAGNHYVNVMEDEEGFVWVGVHFGSRGFGHKTATHFLELARQPSGMEEPPVLLHDATDLGQSYIEAMDLAARYAFAGRDVVVDTVLEILGTHAVDEIHNNHNQIWRETHDGEDWWVVRKGATPAFPGQRGFVGASMAEPAVILEGTEHARGALYSTVHGAGRAMSRNAAAGKPRKRWRNDVDREVYGSRDEALAAPGARKARSIRVREGGAIDFEDVKAELVRKGIELRGGAADEAPGAYKRLSEVLSYHADSVRILHTLTPIGVAMAGADTFDPYKD
ncbi:MAG TPA: RtcB family protein [Solirubrobacteraceae bacterium]|nr:RtcB family protein [Solirubrobacteraceae bacterium]